MNVFIARDGVEIGECPREEVANHLRSGEILETDHYWHEGMETWGRIDDLLGIRSVRRYAEPYAPPVIAPPPQAAEEVGPPPAPKNWRLIAATSLGTLAAIFALGFLIVPPSGPAPADTVASTSLSRAAPSLNDIEGRDRAAADLKERIEKLPDRAVPPLNTFYYDVTVNMNRAPSLRTAWTAVIRGAENTIDAESGETISTTNFTLTAEYSDGLWAFKNYHGSVIEIDAGTTANVIHDEKTPMPPSIVGLIGLTIADDPGNTAISITP